MNPPITSYLASTGETYGIVLVLDASSSMTAPLLPLAARSLMGDAMPFGIEVSGIGVFARNADTSSAAKKRLDRSSGRALAGGDII